MRYVIGDIHGCLETFRKMVEEEIRLSMEDILYLLGDYIDRGPDSIGVVSYILELLEQGFDIRPILGNHEFMLLQSFTSESFFALWTLNGNEATLKSYGAAPQEIMDNSVMRYFPPEHVSFFQGLPYWREDADFMFVHAGIGGGGSDPLNDPDTLLWTRSEYFSEEVLKGKKLIHGHTPVFFETIRERVADPAARVINLDGGCVYHPLPGYGNLVGMNLDTFELYSCSNRG